MDGVGDGSCTDSDLDDERFDADDDDDGVENDADILREVAELYLRHRRERPDLDSDSSELDESHSGSDVSVEDMRRYVGQQ